MNRRDAIKRLAAGGAVTVGASAVLSSRDVAFAASPPDTGLIGVPAAGESIPITFSASRNGTVTLSVSPTVTCSSGRLPTTTYAWKVNGFDFRGRRQRLAIVSGGRVLHNTSGGSGYSSAGTAYRSITIASVSGSRRRPRVRRMSSSDTYDVSVIVTWQCRGANSAVEAEYTIKGSARGASSGTNSSWTII